MNSPKQNISEYLGSITRLQGSLNTLSRSNMRSTDNVQMQMVLRIFSMLKLVSTCQAGCKTTRRRVSKNVNHTLPNH